MQYNERFFIVSVVCEWAVELCPVCSPIVLRHRTSLFCQACHSCPGVALLYFVQYLILLFRVDCWSFISAGRDWPSFFFTFYFNDDINPFEPKKNTHTHTHICKGRDSSVGIATRSGLDGPGIEFRWERDFPHRSRPALGPTQPPVQWVPGHSRGVKRPGRGDDHPHTSKRRGHERVGLYLYSPSGPSRPVIGRTYKNCASRCSFTSSKYTPPAFLLHPTK